MKEHISTTKAPAAIGPYSQAIRAGSLIFTSGQLPIDPAHKSSVHGGTQSRIKKAGLPRKLLTFRQPRPL